jgi:PAS domain S-box-containing protein
MISRLKRWFFFLNWAAILFGGLFTMVSILYLMGWQWEIEPWRHPWAGFLVMNPLTAVGFFLSGLALFMLGPRGRTWQRSFIGILFGAVVFLIGLLRLLSVCLPSLWRVDYLLYSPRIFFDAHLHNTVPMVMVPATAIAFLLVAIALLLLSVRWSKAATIGQAFAIATGLIGVCTLISYLYGIKEFNRTAVTTPMATHSAAIFVLLALALLFARPEKGIMSHITGPYSGSAMSRRFIPFALIVPVTLGWGRLYWQWHSSISVELAMAMLVTNIILCWLAFIGYNTVLLNRRDIANEQVSRALLASEEKFRLLVSRVKDYAIVMLDPAGHVLSWNEASQAITGYRAEEIVGRPTSAFYSPREISEGIPESNLRQVVQKGYTNREGWQYRKDGTPYWAEVAATAIHDDKGQLHGFAVVVRDMTEKKRAQEKIAYQARLMEDSSDAVFSVDPDYHLVSWNKAAETLYGYTAAEVAGKPLNDMLRNPMEDRLKTSVRQELLEQGYWKGDVVYHTRNKGALDISVSISRTLDEQGKIDGYIMVCRDMTERLKAEARLRKFNEELERQVEEKTAALVSSNTELRDLTTRLQQVREEERAVMAREIHDELGQQLTGLKMDLHWVGRKLDGQAPDQARQKLRSTIGLLDKTIQTVRRLATDLRPSILDDLGLIAAIEWQSQEFEKRAGIQTVFRSSINEMEFPPEMAIGMFRICQESLTNVARHASASRVHISLDQLEGEVRMVITDDGKGLDPGQADKARTLGLLGMKERALMMGGRLEIGNIEKSGLQLILTVPLPAVLT